MDAGHSDGSPKGESDGPFEGVIDAAHSDGSPKGESDGFLWAVYGPWEWATGWPFL